MVRFYVTLLTMYVIGLTGNIGTGKSTVLCMLQDLGSAIIDADRVAREVVEPHSPAWHAVRDRFGEEILLPDGQLNREALGRLVFSDANALRDLEAIIHPAVLSAIEQRLAELRRNGALAVTIEAIKLVEGKVHQLCDAIWVVTCTPDQQLARLTETRGWTPHKARQRMSAQAPISDRLAAENVEADVVIDNSGTLARTREQVQFEFQKTVKK